jgi:hypothetical protein
LPILQAHLPGAVNPQISYSPAFLEWEAAAEAGCNLWQWESGHYPTQFKAKVMAWYMLHTQVKNVTEFMSAEKAKKDAKKR